MGSGTKKVASRVGKRPTVAQRAARSTNLRGCKENVPPTTSGTLSALKTPREPKDYKKEHQKMQRKLCHAKAHKQKLEKALTELKSTGPLIYNLLSIGFSWTASIDLASQRTS
ncbi:hypothetical protein B0H10DRAFT_1949775 [Mycena sp. CBHHK59/15]|nr:hypothetical protein B0H10DRAFT_1949775 [Mycena sp. CBHHK59/15]